MKKLIPLLATGALLLVLPKQVHAQAPLVVPCDGDTLNGTYCYVDNDSNVWHWQSECGDPITLQFISGIIGSGLYDVLRIYDGPNDLTPSLFVNGVEDTELAGMTFVSTSGDLYMEMTSNDTISCAEVGGFRTPWEWVWTVTSGIDVTGIGEEDAVQFILYPNPASAGSPVRLSGPAHTPMDIRVLDVTGRTVHHLGPTRSEGGTLDLDLSGLGSGQYSLVISTPAQVGVSKLQIVH